MIERQHLTAAPDRARARLIRDEQWAIMKRLTVVTSLRLRWWGTGDLIDPFALSVSPEFTVTIHGTELVAWIRRHRTWWRITRRRSEPRAVRLAITATGRHALRNRGRYDMEPVEGGFGDDRWRAIPDQPMRAADLASSVDIGIAKITQSSMVC